MPPVVNQFTIYNLKFTINKYIVIPAEGSFLCFSEHSSLVLTLNLTSVLNL